MITLRDGRMCREDETNKKEYMNFSERYGYVKPVDVLKRGTLDEEGINGLCNCFNFLRDWLKEYDISGSYYGYCANSYRDLEEYIWCFFMNELREKFENFVNFKDVPTTVLQSNEYEWYRKMDFIEKSISRLRKMRVNDMKYIEIVEKFIKLINSTFKRLNYAFRIIDDQITEITDEEEIKAIELALRHTPSVKLHLSSALKHLMNRPEADYRNSIKESISAVEAICREITSKNTLGDALKELNKTGINIPNSLKSGFEKLYVYTNDCHTGIRHALMDDLESPTFAEAKFMLVSCSAFINYIQEKRC